jgi:anti-sigma-K factor RskA
MAAVERVPVQPGKDLELWLVEPGARPRSLGVLPSSGKRFDLPASPPAQSQLLVSLEPAGGSPTGAPTGQVLYGGTLLPIR